jgi:UDP-N-acetylmuramoylalanine--D-glutamate ligase
VAVLGAARSGIAAASLLAQEGFRVFVSDLADTGETRRAAEELRARGIEVRLGSHPADRIRESAFVVPSPGIPEDAPVLRAARDAGLPLRGEIEVAAWYATSPIVAVTGTNGKTTTVNLIGRILEAAGRPCRVCGNVGNPLAAVCRDLGPEGWLVVEVSSFQLRHVRAFRPEISVILNVTPDHMDRYETFEAYAADKRRIFMNQAGEDMALFNEMDPAVPPLLAGFRGEAVPVSLGAEGAGVRLSGDRIVWRRPDGEETLFRREELPLAGDHNLLNAMTAAAVARRAGVEAAEIGPALAGFRGLAHRLEEVAVVGGVRFVNDSKATNPGAVAVALGAVGREIVLIAGGKEKGLDYTVLRAAAAGRVRRIVGIGECARRMVEEMAGGIPAVFASDMREAVERAFEAADGRGTVLLSPGTSSFDMYRDFEERGDDFKREVARLGAGG